MLRAVALLGISVLATGLSATAATVARGETQILTYNGMCEASAAVAAGPDHFFAAEDEGNAVRLYARNHPEPVRSETVNVEADDIEAAAAIGNRVYWITSHSLNRKGKDKAPRRYLFATDMVGQGAQTQLKVAGKPYAGLRDDLVEDQGLADFKLEKAAKRLPEDEGGLNIEGLAATPDGKLLIGFRNPVRKGWALVVRLENPDKVIMDGKRAKFGEAMRVDLDGRGIRSLDRVGDGYLIVAGPFDGAKSGFTLRRWTGRRSRASRNQSATRPG